MAIKTKIIATVGPKSNKPEIIRSLILEGVDAIRINMVYGDLNEKKKIIEWVRDIEADLGVDIPILAEIKGRTLRIGEMPEAQLQQGEKLVFRFGDRKSSDMHIIPVPYDVPLRIIKYNDRILLADGRIIVRVDAIKDFEVEGTVLEGGTLRSKARIALRKKSILNLPPITKEDEKIIDFLVKNDVDGILIPDVLDTSDIDYVKSFLESYENLKMRVFARIENADALPKLSGIAKKSDGIVYAKENIENMLVDEERPIADMFLEDLAVRITLKNLKPIHVIVPTLESLVRGTIIKRKDVMVVNSLVSKFFDGLILCSETAIGENPLNSVKSLKTIIMSTESLYEPPKVGIDESDPVYVKFSRGLIALAEMINAKIAVYTTEGRTTLALARFRPKRTIYSFTDSRKTAKYLKLIWGAEPIYIKHAQNFEIMEEELIKRNLIKGNETVVFSYGWRPEIGSKQYILVETVNISQ